MTIKEVKKEIKDYVRDHYKYYGFYPYDVEVGDVVYTYEQYMDILSMTVQKMTTCDNCGISDESLYYYWDAPLEELYYWRDSFPDVDCMCEICFDIANEEKKLIWTDHQGVCQFRNCPLFRALLCESIIIITYTKGVPYA